jgi:hypothetical protein
VFLIVARRVQPASAWDGLVADNADGIFAFPEADGLFMTLSRMEPSGNTRAIRVFATQLHLHESLTLGPNTEEGALVLLKVHLGLMTANLRTRLRSPLRQASRSFFGSCYTTDGGNDRQRSRRQNGMTRWCAELADRRRH